MFLNTGYVKHREVTPIKRYFFHEEKAKSLINKTLIRSQVFF